VNVAGGYHSKGRIDFDDLQGEQQFSGRRAIAQSKLAEVLFTYELARRLEGTGVTANCVDPGLVGTALIEKDRDLPRAIRYGYRLAKPFLRSPDRGAETTVYAASSPELRDLTGKYFLDKRAVASSAPSHDEDTAKRLWDISLALTGLSGR
jgi:NAD(P)-dependent dehydrogenase (short-subunit alcohol dehydrogenase family)